VNSQWGLCYGEMYLALVCFVPEAGKNKEIIDFLIYFYLNMTIKAINLSKHFLCEKIMQAILIIIKIYLSYNITIKQKILKRNLWLSNQLETRSDKTNLYFI